MKKVFIGVGHGGSDPGAVANGFKEKDLNLDIALAARDFLLPYDFDVKMSRVKDENDTLEEEIKECNAFDPILALSAVTLNGAPLAEGTGYTYDEATGSFATVAGVITVPAATYTQQADGSYEVVPGEAVLVVTGTI